MTTRRTSMSRAFTMVELVAVIIVLAILSAVAVPRYFDHTDRARTSSVQGTVGNVRAALSNFYANQAVQGEARYPTYRELMTQGVVLLEPMPRNPYNNRNTVANVTGLQNARRRAANNATGWCYYVNNTADPQLFFFWCNSTETTTASDGSRNGRLRANQL